MGKIFQSAVPQAAEPVDPYEALIAEQMKRIQAMKDQPGIDPQELQKRRDTNQREYELGLLGMLSGSDALTGAGGAVFKNALAQRQPKVTERGSVDQVTGQFTYDPDYLRERETGTLDKLRQLQAAASEKREGKARDEQFRRDMQQERMQGMALLKSMGGSGSNEPLVQIVDPATNQPMFVRRSQAVGMRPAAGAGGAGAKPPAEITRMSIAFDSLGQTITEYLAELESFNPRNPLDQMDPTKRAKMDSLQQRIRVEAKEAAALGALTGPDLALVDSMLSNPAGGKGAMYGREGLKEQAQQMRNWVNVRRQRVTQQYPQLGGATGSWEDPPKQTGSPMVPEGPPSASAGGGLSPAEQSELQQLRQRFGRGGGSGGQW